MKKEYLNNITISYLLKKGYCSIEDQIKILQNLYQTKLTEKSLELFGHDLNLKDYNYIWNRVKESLENGSINNESYKSKDITMNNVADLYIVVFYWYRRYILTYVYFGKLELKNKDGIIKKIENYEDIKEKADKDFSNLFSLLERKVFDYFIERYFYFNDNVKYVHRYEEEIFNVFNLKREYSSLKRCGFTNLNGISEKYPYFLLSITDFMLFQIGSSNGIVYRQNDNFSLFELNTIRYNEQKYAALSSVITMTLFTVPAFMILQSFCPDFFNKNYEYIFYTTFGLSILMVFLINFLFKNHEYILYIIAGLLLLGIFFIDRLRYIV